MGYCFEKGIPHSEFVEWEPEDRAKVIAYSMESSLRCSQCGTAGWEWEENKHAYGAVDEFCQGCYQRAMFSDTESKSLPGTNVKLVPMTPRLKAQLFVKARKREKMLKKSKE